MPRTEKYDHQGVFRPDLATTATCRLRSRWRTAQVLTTATTVPFQFAGTGGTSRYLTPPQYTDFEPRFGFAWQPRGFFGAT